MQKIDIKLKADEEEKLNRPPLVKMQFSILIANDGSEIKDKDLTGWLYRSPKMTV